MTESPGRPTATSSVFDLAQDLLDHLDEVFHTVTLVGGDDAVPTALVLATRDPTAARQLWLALLRGGWEAAVSHAYEYPGDDEAEQALRDGTGSE